MTDQLFVPLPSSIRDSILRVCRSGLIARGVPNPDVTFGSDYWIRAEGLAQQLAPLYANQQIRADQTMPDTATGADLTRILAMFGLQPRDAQPSVGPVVLNSNGSVFIPDTQQLIDGQGQTYRVTTGATYAAGADVPIIAIATGKGTNHPQGTVLRWVGTPSGADIKALVGVGGLVDGADKDTDETSRNRLFDYFRNPPQGGNWSQVAQWCVAASASVQAAYVYPALNGPATFAVCVVGPLVYDATNGWSRGLSDTIVGTVQAYLAGVSPEYADKLIMSPKDVGGAIPNIDTDVSIGLSLPLSTAGGGPGGGWTDASPWPALLGTATRVSVSVVTDTTHLTLTSNDAATTPTTTTCIAGETQIAWFSSAEYAAGRDPIVTAIVTAVGGSTGAVTVTLNKPFTGIIVGDYVMPMAENIQAYGRAYLAAMNQMGPSQWTSNPSVLVHASRYPLVTSSNPSDFTSTLLRTLTDVGDEVLDGAYLYRNITTPTIPVDTRTVSPNILVPRRFAFYNLIP